MASLRTLRSLYLSRRNPTAYARHLGVQVGDRVRIYGPTGATFGSEPYLIRLGDDVTVTSGVRFVTHDGAVDIFRDEYPELEIIAPIVVEDRVFLGLNSILLPGVTVGSRSIIGAGSLVNRDVAPGMVVAGVPARVLCTADEYRAKALARGVHFRNIDPATKRTLIRRTFAPPGAGAPEPRLPDA